MGGFIGFLFEINNNKAGSDGGGALANLFSVSRELNLLIYGPSREDEEVDVVFTRIRPTAQLSSRKF